jgi:hypothetical protein
MKQKCEIHHQENKHYTKAGQHGLANSPCEELGVNLRGRALEDAPGDDNGKACKQTAASSAADDVAEKRKEDRFGGGVSSEL